MKSLIVLIFLIGLVFSGCAKKEADIPLVIPEEKAEVEVKEKPAAPTANVVRDENGLTYLRVKYYIDPININKTIGGPPIFSTFANILADVALAFTGGVSPDIIDPASIPVDGIDTEVIKDFKIKRIHFEVVNNDKGFKYIDTDTNKLLDDEGEEIEREEEEEIAEEEQEEEELSIDDRIRMQMGGGAPPKKSNFKLFKKRNKEKSDEEKDHGDGSLKFISEISLDVTSNRIGASTIRLAHYSSSNPEDRARSEKCKWKCLSVTPSSDNLIDYMRDDIEKLIIVPKLSVGQVPKDSFQIQGMIVLEAGLDVAL